MNQASKMGTEPIGPLLMQQAIPAAIGFLVLSIYGIVDTIFVGRWVGPLGIGAITVVLPITFLIGSVGMAIGVGGASIISRAFGAENEELAQQTFGNQIALTLSFALLIAILGSIFQEEILLLFGGQGDILEPSKAYFKYILPGIPFLAWAMMSNNVLRAEGRPKMAMMTLVIPAIVNVLLDPILIIGFDMGIEGAALATAISYVASASFGAWFFIAKKGVLRINSQTLFLKLKIVKEIFSIGSVTFARQGVVSLLAIVLNNTLFQYGGEVSVSVYGIINRLMMFAIFPILGITQGFLPIAGFNYGAENYARLRDVIKKALIWGTGFALIIFIGIVLFPKQIASIFTTDQELLTKAAPALVYAFLATPLITLQMIGSAYFQAIGRAVPALLLTLTKQGFFLIPLILILPNYFGINGVWYSFPIADTMSAIISFSFMSNQLKKIPIE